PPGSRELLVGPPSVGPPADGFTVVRTIDTGGRPTSTLAFSPDGRVLAAAKWRQIHFWDTATGKEIRDPWPAEEYLDTKDGEITFLAFVDAKTVAVRADPGNIVHIRSYPSGEGIGRIDLGTDATDCFVTAPGLIASAAWRDRV